MSFTSAMQSLFGGVPNTNPNAPGVNPANPINNPMQTANPGNPLPGTVSNPTTAPNGVVPEIQTIDPNAAPVSPLDTFKDLWNTSTPTPGSEPKPSWISNIDPNKVLESAKKVDFAKNIPPEILARIEKGGPDAMVALTQAMNLTNQSVYGNSAIATAKMVERALKDQQEDFLSQLPSLVRKFSANENLRTENPILNNPAVQPLVGALSEQLIRKNPNATEAELKAQISGYFDAIGLVFAPKPVLSPEAKRAAEGATDWSKFMES